MAIRNDLKNSISKVLNHNRDGSYSTQADRRNILEQFANDLVSLGYGLRDISGLKQKHIFAIIESWQEKKLAIATIKNRTAVLRFLCEKINKSNLIPSNAKLGMGRRKYVPTTNKALKNTDFQKIKNSYVRLSLELQRVFGLRREEALKIKPYLADKGTYLQLSPSWCKGGRGRSIPIYTAEQRYWLEQAKQLVGKVNHSLIPPDKSYICQRYVYDKQVGRAGFKNLHGLRHAYAQRRYKELTGWEAPLNGGPQSRELTFAQKQMDYKARMVLSEELGHSRKQITVNYLG